MALRPSTYLGSYRQTTARLDRLSGAVVRSDGKVVCDCLSGLGVFTMALESCPRQGPLALSGRCGASTSLRTRAHLRGGRLSGGGATDRLPACLATLSVSANVRQQKTPESSAGLGPTGDREHLGTMERRYFNLGAQGCLGKGNRYLEMDLCTVTLEEFVGSHMDNNIEITGRPAAAPFLPFASQTQARPIIDSSRDLDGEFFWAVEPRRHRDIQDMGQ